MIMSTSDVVSVYAFLTMDRGVESSAVAPFKATRHAIESRFQGHVLEGTAQDVDPSELDEQGRLVRRPTGWGDLPDH